MDLPRKFEIHYYLSDNSHSMNALVKNKCEAEFLAVAIELADVLGVPLELDCEALKEGGIREVWKVLGENGTQAALIISTLALLWSIVPKTDQELVDLQKDDLRLSIKERKLAIDKIKLELEQSAPSIDSVQAAVSIASDNYKVATRKSNFYKILSNYEKVSKLGFTEKNIEDKVLTDEKTVERADFQKFILRSNKLEPLTDNNAHVEIVAPVLKEGKAKWKGLYKGKQISFAMDDKEFKRAVITKQISFQNGDEIICVLLIHKVVDELGDIVTSGYSVEVVLENLHSGALKETSQGKHYRHTQKMKDNQCDMFEGQNA